MDKLVVRGTEINVQWDLKRDDLLIEKLMRASEG